MLIRTSLYAGAFGGTAALVVASLLARREGGRGWTPVNAAAHLLWQDEAAADRPDPVLTPTGLAINAGAATFWGGVLALRLRRQPARSGADIFREAGLVAASAALLDYGLLPRRLSPGWELGLSPGSIAVVFAALGAGLGAGASLADRSSGPRGISKANRPSSF